MEKYFELTENGNVLNGVIINIPEDVTNEQVKQRIESSDEKTSIVIVDKTFDDADIIFDWVTLDYEQGFDKDVLDISDILEKSIRKGVETEVVYTALKAMKDNSELSISDAITIGKEKWLK